MRKVEAKVEVEDRINKEKVKSKRDVDTEQKRPEDR